MNWWQIQDYAIFAFVTIPIWCYGIAIVWGWLSDK